MRDVERRRAAEEIDLAFGAGGTVEDADGSTRRRDRPHEPFHRFVARAVAVLLDQVLPDPLQAQTGVELLGDRRRDTRRRRTAARREPGNVLAGFGAEPANVLAAFESLGVRDVSGIGRWRRVGAGERFGRICLAQPVVAD